MTAAVPRSGAGPVDTGPAIFARFRQGMAYAEYEARLAAYAAEPVPDGASAEDRTHRSFAGINLQRATRIARTYVPGDGIGAVVRALPGPQLWGVLSEVWCGDSVQVIPYLDRIAGLRADIDLRILLRDEHPDVMQCYLTGGKRCIPKLILFDAAGRELGSWGPRPAGAQATVDDALAAGLPKEERLQRVHLWYGRDRGLSLESELAVLLQAGTGVGAD